MRGPEHTLWFRRVIRCRFFLGIFASILYPLESEPSLRLELPLAPGLRLACTIRTTSDATILLECAQTALEQAKSSLPAGLIETPQDLIRHAVNHLRQQNHVTIRDMALAACVQSSASCRRAAELLFESVMDVSKDQLQQDYSSYHKIVAAVENATQRHAARVVCDDRNQARLFWGKTARRPADDFDFIVIDESCPQPSIEAFELGLRHLRLNSGLLATHSCWYESSNLDVGVAYMENSCVTLVRRKPGRSRFQSNDINVLVHHVLVWKAVDIKVALGSCTTAEALAQSNLWKAIRGAIVGDTESWEYTSLLGCPQSSELERAVFDAIASDARNSQTAHRVIVHVGANKGYGLARSLLVLAPELDISPRMWGGILKKLGARYACGWCRDCLEVETAWNERKRTAPYMTVDAHLVEPLTANYDLLSSTLAAAGFAEVSCPHPFATSCWTKETRTARAIVHLYRLACGDTSRIVQFPNLAAGAEVGSFCTDDCNANQFAGQFETDRPTYEAVPAERLDRILPTPITLDMLVIDAEGADPLILAGAQQSLVNTRFLQFEYHFRGAWMPPQSLKNIVAELDLVYGFECYMHGPDSSLWRISRGCWDDAFEIRQWSNVACVKRDDIQISTAVAGFAVVGL